MKTFIRDAWQVLLGVALIFVCASLMAVVVVGLPYLAERWLIP